MRNRFFILPLSLLFVAACGEDEAAESTADETAAPTADGDAFAPPAQPSTEVPLDDISWFMRGGSLNRARLLKPGASPTRKSVSHPRPISCR